jgi:hypothetical protein
VSARPSASAIDAAASELRASSRAFTRANLYHAFVRARPELRARWSLERFCDEALAPLLGRRSIAGLLPETAPRCRRGEGRRSGPTLDAREWAAYFPTAILVVDRPAIVDLFAASGALVQARVAVVSADGTPARVVDWLRRGVERGHRAPVGYLHDANTSLYPFLLEPLATLVRARGRGPLAYRDLGIGPGRPLRDPLGIARADAAAATRLEEVPPCTLVAYAVQEVLRMVPPDPMLLPIQPQAPRTR